MAAPFTHAELAAKLVTEFCLPAIEGKVQGALPIKGHVLPEADRAKILGGHGLDWEKGGFTAVYPIDRQGVFVDMGGAVSRVFFTGADCERGLQVLEASLKAAYPQAKQTEDKARPGSKGLRARAYRIEFDPARLASVEVAYPAPGAKGEDRRFMVWVHAAIRQNVLDDVLKRIPPQKPN